MRILVTDPRFPAFFARNISVILEAMGHEVTNVN